MMAECLYPYITDAHELFIWLAMYVALQSPVLKGHFQYLFKKIAGTQ